MVAQRTVHRRQARSVSLGARSCHLHRDGVAQVKAVPRQPSWVACVDLNRNGDVATRIPPRPAQVAGDVAAVAERDARRGRVDVDAQPVPGARG